MADGEKKQNYFNGEHIEYYGDKWAAISKDSNEFFKRVLRAMYDKENTEIIYLKEINNTKYLGLLCEKKSLISFLIILEVTKEDEETNNLLSAYPILKGCSNNVILKEKYTWSIEAEGEMACITADNQNIILNFHNPFFALDIDNFKVDTEKTISLAGLAYSIKQLQEYEFKISEGEFYNINLKKFLEENPDKTETDFEIPTVCIKRESFRMIRPTKYISEYTISGIIKNISEIVVLDEPIKVLNIDLGHEENDKPLLINIFVSNQICSECILNIGDNITAVIWLTGYFEN